MESVAPTIGNEITLTADGIDISGTLVGKLRLKYAPSLSSRDGKLYDVVVLLTDTENPDPFKRAGTCTFRSLLKVESHDNTEDFYTDDSLDKAKKVFSVPEIASPGEFNFGGINVKKGQKLVLELEGELVLMEANSIVYDKNGKALLLLSQPIYQGSNNYLAAITTSEFGLLHPTSWCENYTDAPTINELLFYILDKSPEGIGAGEFGIKDKRISVEMVIECWNNAKKRLPVENIKDLYYFGLRGAEGAFYDISEINEEFGNHLVRLFRGKKK